MLNPIQSARLRSSRGFNFRYGKVEVEARLPVGDWLWPGTSSRLCFVVGCRLVRHYFCALWLAVAWYVITFVLCVWLWPGTSSLLCFVIGCGVVRHESLLCFVVVCGLVRQSLLCFVVGCGLVRQLLLCVIRERERGREREHR